MPIVLTGLQNAHWQAVAREIRRLGVNDLVHHLGFVDTNMLRSLYAAADALVFPSLYEGWGLPVVEALDVGLPVLCSNISPLREITGDAAARFDPTEPDSIAEVIHRLWKDGAERDRLATAARGRRGAFSWTATAALFRAHYRAVAGRPPIGEDARLLSAPPLI